MKCSNICVNSWFSTTWHRRSPRRQSNCCPFTIVFNDQCSSALSPSYILSYAKLISWSEQSFKLVPISVASVNTITPGTYHQLWEKLFSTRIVKKIFADFLVSKFNASKIQIFVSIASVFSKTGNPTILILKLLFEPWMG